MPARPQRPVREPSSDATDARFYVPRRASEEALAELRRWLEAGRGAAVVAGAPGAGTTLLLRVLEARERPRRRVLFSPFLHIEPEAVERWLISLALRARGISAGDPLLAALGLDAGPAPAPLLLVDEAQASTPAALAELGRLTRTRVPALRVVLAGCAGDALDRASEAFGGERMLLELPEWSSDELYKLGRAICERAAPGARLAGVDLEALAEQAGGSPRMLKHALALRGATPAAAEPAPRAGPEAKPVTPAPETATPAASPPRPRRLGLAVKTLAAGLVLLAGFGLGILGERLLRSIPPPQAEALDGPGPAVAAAPPTVFSVHVNAQPWAWIRIDGKEAGATPLVHADVAGGPHEFEATFPDGRRVRRIVDVGPDSRFVAFR